MAIIVGLILLGVGGGMVWYFFNVATPSSQTNSFATSTTDTSSSSVVVRTPPSGVKEYHSSRFGFSILYPENLSINEYNETDGGVTASFQNPETAEGFQIYAVSYNEPKVTPERFKEDEPSGVLQNPTVVTIDGTTGSAFYSKSTALGDIYEVWFIHNGTLFEITTLKPLDTWLQNILQSLIFI
jgi:hypothetical protein